MPVLAWLNSTLDGTRHNVRDMIVAKRGFVFAASPEHDSYISAKILAAFPYETPVLGYPCINDPYSFNGVPCESFGVGQVSNNGKFVIPSDLGANLTVFSHLALTTTATVPPWNEATPTGFGFPADPTKTYVGFLVSDGDNVGYNMEYLRAHHWVDPARGTIPIGYSISPWLKQFAPRIYDYFVRTLKPDEVLADGPSGAGYMYPGVDPDLSGYLKQAKPLLQQAGLKSVWILDYGYSASPTPFTTQQYVDALHPSVIFTDYPGFLFPNPPAVSFSKGVPVIHALFGGYTPNPVNDTVNQIRLATATANTRPAFVLVALDTWNMGPKEAVQVMNQLGPSYLAVRPDQFVGMIKALGGVNIPESPVMPPPPPTLPPFQLPVCIPGPPPADPGC